MQSYVITDSQLYDITGLLVTVRGRNPHRSGQPQLYVWLPGRRACSVYGSISQYAARRPQYAAFVRQHIPDADSADAILTAIDEIADAGVADPQTWLLRPVVVDTRPAMVRYEVQVGKWFASVSREVRR